MKTVIKIGKELGYFFLFERPKKPKKKQPTIKEIVLNIMPISYGTN